jgi:uracil-DNA glycosylase
MAKANYLAECLVSGNGWEVRLSETFEQPFMQNLARFLADEDAAGKVLYPALENCFAALNATAFDKVKVIILGQDPYHGPGQAHGLCFSVLPGVKPPPSLQNIFREINRDLHLPTPTHGCLGYWAQQGVLLLNAVLTVEQGRAASHQGLGWETFTDTVINLLAEERENLVFLLWGSHAQRKGSFISRDRHMVLQAAHPSPLSAHRGFIGCGHFSTCNAQLQNNGLKPVDWRLPPIELLDSSGFLVKKAR